MQEKQSNISKTKSEKSPPPKKKAKKNNLKKILLFNQKSKEENSIAPHKANVKAKIYRENKEV